MPKVFEQDGYRFFFYSNEHRPMHVHVRHGGHVIVAMESGVEIRFPVAGNPRLAAGTPKQLAHIEVSPYGLHWPDLDEDLSFRGLLEGDYGQSKACRSTCWRSSKNAAPMSA